MDPGIKLLIGFSLLCGAAIAAIGFYDLSPLETLFGVAIGLGCAEFWRRQD